MRIVIICALIIIDLIFESTVFQYLRIFNIKPDFIIILIVSYAILRGKPYGAFIGLFAGLLVDMMYGRAIGISGLTYMITGYLIGQVHENVFKDSYLPAIIFNILAVIISQHLYFLVSYLSSNTGSLGLSYVYILVKIILPQCVYNGILGGILYRYIYRLEGSKFMDVRIY